MKRILLPTDFSKNADNAIKYAFSMFGDEAEYILLHSFEMPAIGAGTLAYLNDILYQEIKQDLKNKYEELINDPVYRGFNISMLAEIGEPATVITDVARRENISLIVMGTKGATGLKELFIGSNTNAVISRTVCPVIAIPENASYRKPHKIVFAADMKPYQNRNVILPLVKLAKKFKSEILILNVQKDNIIVELDPTQGSKLLNGFLHEFNHSFHSVGNVDIEEGINSFLDKNDAAMLAVVSRKHNYFSKLVKKSISAQLAMHTHIPLLVMNEASRESGRAQL